MAARETDIIMDFIVNNKELIQANKEMEQTLGNTKQMGKEAKRMSGYYSEGYGRWRHEQKLLTAETRAMMYEMKYGWMNNSAAYAQVYNDQIRARYGMYQLAKAGKEYDGTTKQLMRDVYALGLADKKAKDMMIDNDMRLRQSFYQQAGMMANMTTQAQRISDGYKEMKNPLLLANLGTLAMANSLNKFANNGNAANLALKRLGANAGTKRLNDEIMKINQGMMRFQMVALGAVISSYLFYGAMHKLGMQNAEYANSFNTMVATVRKAIQPMVDVFIQIATAIFDFVTKIATLVIAFNKVHPTLARFIQGIFLLVPALVLILSPLAVGIGLFAGFQAALFSLWAFIGPVVTGLAAMSGTVYIVAGAISAALIAFFKFANVGQLVDKAITTLSKAFSTLKQSVQEILSGDFSSLGDLFKTLLPTIIGVAVGGIPGLLISLGARFIPSLAQGMQSGGGSIVTTINNIFASITSFIQTQLPTMLAMGLGIVRNLVLGIIQALPSLMQGFITLFQSLIPMIATLLPVLLQVGLQIVMALAQGILQAAVALVPVLLQFIQQLITIIGQLLPLLINTGIQLVMMLIQGIITMLPSLISTALQLVTVILNTIVTYLPQILNAGIQILMSLIQGILQILPQLITVAFQAITTLVTGIISHLPQILAAGVRIIMMLIQGITSMLGQLLSAGWSLVQSLASKLGSIDLVSVGKNVMQGFLNGIVSIGKQIKDTVAGIANSVMDTIKSVTNTHSPSRKMFELGEFQSIGFANGINATANQVYKASVNLATQPMSAVEAPNVTSTVGNTSNNSATYTFAPQITVQGGGDGGNITADIHSALEVSYNDMFKQLGLGTGGLG